MERGPVLKGHGGSIGRCCLETKVGLMDEK